MKWLEDYLINKYQGWYLYLYASERYVLANLVGIMSDTIVNAFVFLHLFSERLKK